MSKPIRRIRSAGCECAARGQAAAALPSPAMNSRRSISDLLPLDRQPIAVGAVCLALPQSFLQRGRPVLAHLGSGVLHCSMLVRAYLEKVLEALEAKLVSQPRRNDCYRLPESAHRWRSLR